jgi:uncharacterized protein
MNATILKDFLHSRLGHESSGHDVYHAERVCANAFALARLEAQHIDAEVLEAAALLHDVLDHKLVGGDEIAALRERVKICLISAGLSAQQCAHVFAIWDAMGYRGKDAVPDMPSLEGRLLLDADRLDAMGAVGIARCFAYGGKKGRLLYDPQEEARAFTDMESYRNHAGSSLNHFYEKLFHLQNQMQTAAARQVAAERHRFMEEFVERFKREWAGTDL